MSTAQNIVNEYSRFECSHSKLISFPFSEPVKKAVVNQTVFYQHRDQFSYWYKILVNEASVVNCKITPINNNDSYVLYVYKYAKSDFCNKVFYGKIDPLKGSFFMNNNDSKEAFELSEVQFKAKKDESYYFCVLTTSLTNCGHLMNLAVGKDTINVRAIHFPCSEEDADVKAQTKLPVNKAIETSAATNQAKILQVIELNVMEENNANKKVDARIQIKDELTGNEMEIKSTGQNSYTIEIEKGKTYKVECLATGYKKFDHPVVISEYVHPDSGKFNVFLRPLKAGDNFVMDKIYFFPNTYALKKESEKEIAYLLNYMINNPDVRIELQGHTNGNSRIGLNKAYRGKGPEWNFKGSSKKLSMYRAETIRKHLVDKGIAAEKISTAGFGGDRMIIENAKTLDAIQKNVRVEVVIR